MRLIPKISRDKDLVAELLKREFSGRYRGSFGGVAWSFAQPLFLLTVYTVAFGVILKTRWGLSGGIADFALLLFAGLIVFNACAECLAQAPTLITNNPNFVKKVVFPLEILPWVMALTAIAHALVGVAVWLAGYVVLKGVPPWTAILFPLVLACLFPVLLGLGWLLSSLGVFARDLAQLTLMLSHALLFLTPIFYSLEAAPQVLQRALLANPLTFIVEQLRQVLFFGVFPGLRGLAVYFGCAVVFAWVSWRVFRHLRPRFADLV